jgi:putative membrane protein
MSMFAAIQIAEFVGTLFYAFLGLGLMILFWAIIEWVTPFSLRKEIEEEHNMAIAVLMGAIFIALSILISAVILS